MKVAIAADHRGFELKEQLRVYLEQQGYEVVDVGPHSYEPKDDYPDYAAPAAGLVSRGEADRAILVCDSGIGMDIVANKTRGVRSAVIHDVDLARRARSHNDTNCISLPAMTVDFEAAKRIVDVWLTTEFGGVERHARRIRKIEEME